MTRSRRPLLVLLLASPLQLAFVAVPAHALNVIGVEILQSQGVGASASCQGFDFSVEVVTDDAVVTVEVTSPGAAGTVSLSESPLGIPGFSVWEFASGCFADAATRNAQFGTGSYGFDFDSGSTTFSLPYSVSPATGIGNVIQPAEGSSSVDPNGALTIEWDCPGCAGSGFGIIIKTFPEGEGVCESFDDVEIIPFTATSYVFDPGTCSFLFGKQYSLELDLISKIESDENEAGQSFTYLQENNTCKFITFSTLPGAVPALGLIGAVLLGLSLLALGVPLRRRTRRTAG